MKKPKSDLCYLKPLYTLCNFLAITPPHSYGSCVTSVSIRFKMYTLLHIAIDLLLYVHSSYGRENYIYQTMDVTVALTDKIANFMLTFFNVMLRVVLIFANGKTTKLFYNQMYDLSVHDLFEACSPRVFRIHFAIFNFYMVALILSDAYLWINSVGVRMFQYYVGRSFTYYMCNLSIFLIFHSVLPIKHFFASLGTFLETLVKNLVCSDDDGRKEYVLSEFRIQSVPVKDSCYDLRKVRKYYNSICDMVDNFNQIYGLAILMVIIVVITYVLNLTDLLLVYGVSKDKNIGGASYGTDLIILCGFWMVTLLMFTILLAYGCAGAISKSENVAKICFFWINEIPSLPTSHRDQELKEELSLLVQQSTSRCPKFSAAGFFPVDFTLLGFIFGTVTSYIIISIQFIDH
ncbi:hypothetical protein Zmor_000124 [Zophobas morio]|uniref:Gustatory receptor n=1 Tax=Zophobas morio TaxID=2755281 RepID=A0AA38MQY2_9CUCU|nr:hypothetical protein Zmor_000124 [Zophobas morio]